MEEKNQNKAAAFFFACFFHASLCDHAVEIWAGPEAGAKPAKFFCASRVATTAAEKDYVADVLKELAPEAEKAKVAAAIAAIWRCGLGRGAGGRRAVGLQRAKGCLAVVSVI